MATGAASATNGAASAEDYTPHNILVTGGAGFIASAFVLRMVEKYPSYKIVVLDKLDYCASRKHLEHLEPLRNFKFIKGDVQEADLLNYLLESEQIDTILHFAAQTHVDNSFGNSVIFTTNNVLGTHVLLEAAKRAMPRMKRFVHVSTDEVYGENPGQGDEVFNEMSKMEPTNPYAATKASAEMLCTGYWHSYKLPIIVTRGNNVYGPRQYPEKLVPKMINLALRGMPLWIHGNGQQRRSYLHVEDVASAFDVIMHKGVVGERYNIGTNVDRTVLDVVQTIAKHLDVPKDRIKHVEDRVFNDQRYYMDSSKLIKLGWKEEQNWVDGLKATIDWYKEYPTYWHNLSTALLPHPQLPADADAQAAEEVAHENGAEPHLPEQPAPKAKKARK